MRLEIALQSATKTQNDNRVTLHKNVIVNLELREEAKRGQWTLCAAQIDSLVSNNSSKYSQIHMGPRQSRLQLYLT